MTLFFIYFLFLSVYASPFEKSFFISYFLLKRKTFKKRKRKKRKSYGLQVTNQQETINFKNKRSILNINNDKIITGCNLENNTKRLNYKKPPCTLAVSIIFIVFKITSTTSRQFAIISNRSNYLR